MRVALLCSSRCPGTIIVHGLDGAIALKDAPVSIVGGCFVLLDTVRD